MKTKKVLSAVVAGCMLLGSFTAARAESKATMVIDTSSVVKTTTGDMYGISTDYSIDDMSIKDYEAGDTSPNPNMVKAFNEYKIPLVRLGEGALKIFEWKKAIGALSERENQTLWNQTGIVKAGPIEKINLHEAINKDAAFTVTLNMTTDSAQDAADFAQFLTGSASSEWGAKRAAMGHAAPVNVRLYELGNELDWGDDAITVETYIAKCKEFVAAIKAVQPDARFAAHANTAAYNGVARNDPSDWREWHKAILADAELAGEIDYLAVHAYYSHYSNEVMDKVIGAVESDIAASAGANRIKIFLSEYAESVYTYGDQTTNPHNMEGVLQTADMLSRMTYHTGIESATYHGIYSSHWQNVVYDSATGKMQLNAIGNLLKMFTEYGVGDILESTFTGFEKDKRSSGATGVAIRTEDGRINLIMSNKAADAANVDISFSDNSKYRIVKETRISADSLEADITNTENKIAINKYYSNGAAVSSYTLPAYSVCAVTLEKTASAEKTVLYSNDFSTASEFKVEGTGTAAAENGKLVLYSGDEMTLTNNYAYLPFNNTSAAFRYEADITVDAVNFDEAMLGIILNADASGGVLQNGNMIRFRGSAADEVVYTDGIDGASIATAVTSGLAAGYSAHITVDASTDGTVELYINGERAYSRSGGLKNSTGYTGFLFNDVNCSVDNACISNYSETPVSMTDIEKNFTYTENFDNVENGKLPEGWEVMNGGVIAGVEDGALIIESRDWSKPGWVRIGNIPNVNRAGLTMEADVTAIAQDEDARNAGSRNKGGFAYMADGENLSTAGRLTFWNQGEFTESGQNEKPTANGMEDGFQTLGTTSKIKLVFTGATSPDIYVNGKKYTYYNLTGTAQNSGDVGLFAVAAKIKFDNVKITGMRTTSVESDKVVEKLVDFRYEENFDDVTDGTLPAGWKTYNDATASVKNGKLVLDMKEWYSQCGVLIPGLEKVLRDGLVIEGDVTLNSYDASARSYGTRNQYGFGYMKADGYIGSAGILTWWPQVEFRETGIENPATASTASVLGSSTEYNVTNKTVRLKLVFSGNSSPSVFIDGTECKENYYPLTGTTGNIGAIGLMGRVANATYDNIVITGKKYETLVDESTYAAEFTTGTNEFESAQAAVNAVKVTETAADGTKTDVTADAIITPAVDGTDCTITVEYGGKVIATLKAKIAAAVAETFVYEESFDTLADGTLPSGWTVYDYDAGWSGKVSAKVQDGALVLKSEEWYRGGYLLLDLDDVQRKGLTFEADITKAGSIGGNPNNSKAGIAYMAAVNADGTAAGSHVSLFTDVTSTNHRVYVGRNGDKLTDYSIDPAEGEQSITDGGTVNLKIVSNSDTSTPDIYINGVKKNNWTVDDTTTLTSGRIGFFAYNSAVKIDNVKITGTRTKEMTLKSEIKLNSARYDGEKLALSVDAQSADANITNAMCVAAAYDKQSGELKAMSAVKLWNTAAYKNGRISLEIPGIADYSAEKYDVKVIITDKQSMKPLSACVIY